MNTIYKLHVYTYCFKIDRYSNQIIQIIYTDGTKQFNKYFTHALQTCLFIYI